MRRTLLALAVLAVAAWPATHAFAQDAKKVTGTVTAMAADSVSVKVANVDMKFAVDAKTTVEASGAGTKAAAAMKAGAAGPKLADVVKVGQNVEVTYHEMGGTNHAAMIRRVSSPGASPAASTRSSGKVTAVAADSMSISGTSGGGASFSQTFTIDSKTKVTGKGAGTAAAAKGGKVVVTDIVHTGDTVSVSFHDMGGTLHAASITVTMKAAK